MIARLIAVTASALVTASMTGCTTNASDEPAPNQNVCRATGFADPFDRIDPCVGEQVLLGAVEALFTYQPVQQSDPSEAVRTAHPLLDHGFAAQATTAARVWGPITTDQWQQWRTDRTEVHTRVRMSTDDHPSDTPTRLSRVLGVELTPSAASPIDFPAYATVTRTGPGQAWRLAGLQVPR